MIEMISVFILLAGESEIFVSANEVVAFRTNIVTEKVTKPDIWSYIAKLMVEALSANC